MAEPGRHQLARWLLGVVIALTLALPAPGASVRAATADVSTPTAESDGVIGQPTPEATQAVETPPEPPLITPQPAPTDEPLAVAPTQTAATEPSQAPTLPEVVSPDIVVTDAPVEETPEPAATEASPSPSAPAPTPARQMRAAEFQAAGTAILPLQLTLSPAGSVVAGTSVSAQAFWTSRPLGKPTGTVQYRVFSGTGCAGALFAEAGTKTVVSTGTNGSVAASDVVVLGTSGSHSWRASYSGDAAYAVATVCVNQTVTKSSPTLTLPALGSVPAATSATATAMLSGATAAAGGSVTYTVYGNSTCTTQLSPPQSSTVTVVNRTVPVSAPLTFQTVGSVYWRASYGGDANNNAAISGCISQTVTKANPALALTTSPNPVVVGSPSSATATLGAATAGAGGSVTYTVYATSSCGSLILTSTVTVTNGVVPPSIEMTPTETATVYARASYTGDANNNAAVSPCITITIVKASPTVSLTVTPVDPPMRAARPAFGAATLAMTAGEAEGSVTYTVYTDDACTMQMSGSGNPSTRSLDDGDVPDSANITMQLSGTLYWRAGYSGDDLNNAAISPCVALVVAKADPALTQSITVDDSPMRAGGDARSRGTLSTSTTTSTAGGTATYTVYTDSACTTIYAATNNPNTATVTNRSIPNSAWVTFGVSGTFHWQVAYSGDAHNNPALSPCTALVVAQASPNLSLTVTPSVSPMTTGSTATGAATLSQSTASAGGTVTYTVYANSNCTTLLMAPGSPSTVTVTGGVSPASAAITINAVGTVYWRAAYSGDAHNEADTSSCVSQSVAKRSPTLALTTSPAGAVAVESAVTGTAALAGATADAGGQATYTVYSNSGCTTLLTVAGSPSVVAVANAVVQPSASIRFTSLGTVYWRVRYAGDARNNVALSACVALTVTKAAPTLSLTVTPAVSPMEIGGSATGSATLSGATSSAGGTVTYVVFSDNTCVTEMTPSMASTKMVSTATVPSSDVRVFNQSGTFYWRASYSGDALNLAAVSPCVALVVANPVVVAVDLSIAPNPVDVGDGAIGNATLTGVTPSAGGTMTYVVFSDATCQIQLVPAVVSTKEVTGGIAAASDPLVFNQVGTVYWRASYSGDANNAAAISSCVALTVVKRAPTLAISLSAGEIIVWESASAAATLTGATLAAGGMVTYVVYVDGGCTTPVVPAQSSTVTVTGEVVPGSDAFTFDRSGVSGVRASYSGDANNDAAVSPCAMLTVTAGALTASIGEVALAPVAYSDSEQSNSGALVLSVSDRRGTFAGWSISLAVSSFAYSGSSPSGVAIPAGAFAITGGGDPGYSSGQPIDGEGGPRVPDDDATGPLDEPVVVLEAEVGTGAGVYEQTLDVALTIPAGSQAGSYTGVIDIVITAAP